MSITSALCRIFALSQIQTQIWLTKWAYFVVLGPTFVSMTFTQFLLLLLLFFKSLRWPVTIFVEPLVLSVSVHFARGFQSQGGSIIARDLLSLERNDPQFTQFTGCLDFQMSCHTLIFKTFNSLTMMNLKEAFYWIKELWYIRLIISQISNR